MTIALHSEIAGLREQIVAWRATGKRIALVPTMGALHAGHMALVEAARSVADRVVVTIFVNPTQFAPNEDFDSYPRDLAADCARVEASGADFVYAPERAAMYPPGFATSIHVEGPAVAGLEDRFRPTHFAGVATIVAKLFLQALSDVAFFGEKDFQQLRAIERMVRDLDIPVAIRGVPTVREPDGLAMSSRNVNLDAGERARAPAMYRALADCAAAIGQGAPSDVTVTSARQMIESAGFVVDYVEARCAATLAQLTSDQQGPIRILAAARLGRTRLIDNVGVDP